MGRNAQDASLAHKSLSVHRGELTLPPARCCCCCCCRLDDVPCSLESSIPLYAQHYRRHCMRYGKVMEDVASVDSSSTYSSRATTINDITSNWINRRRQRGLASHTGEIPQRAAERRRQRVDGSTNGSEQ